MNLYDKALNIATRAHKGQIDKAGTNYVEHPIYVASLVSGEEERATALLHDVIEDTTYTEVELLNMEIPQSVVEAVSTLTREQNIPYKVYLDRVKKNELARVVKLADLQHNSDLSRLKKITENDLKRQKKYKKAIEYLL